MALTRYALPALPALPAIGTALLGLLPAPNGTAAEAAMEAQFRGCEAAGWCRFRLEPADPSSQTLHQVRPVGVVQAPGDSVLAVAVRDRLNALLASMIHQHKQIVLHGLRDLGDGTHAARVTANGADVACDPQLLELRAKLGSATR